MSHHILLLEDDADLTRLIKTCLQQQHYIVSSCSHAHRAALFLSEQQVDLILCDVMLPGKNGFDFVAEIRQHFDGPILFMTAQSSIRNQLQGLALGAQDYLVKPVDPRILLAKLRVFLPENNVKTPETAQINLHNLIVDQQTRKATLAGQLINLTSAEFKLLQALALQFGKVVSREWLFQQHLGREYDGMTRTMDGRASRLRKKMQQIDPRWQVVTSWGEGYYLSYEPQAQ